MPETYNDKIKVHHLRHTVGSLLKDLHVPPRDVQIICSNSKYALHKVMALPV